MGRHPNVQVLRRSGLNRQIWFVYNACAESAQLQLPNAPVSVWDSDGADCVGANLNLPPGALWMAELSK